MKSPCSLDENFNYVSLAPLFSKVDPLANQFNTILRRVLEAGIAYRYWEQLKREALLRGRTKSDEDGSSMFIVFTVYHMGPVFSVLCFGYLCRTIVCIAECFHKRFSKSWQTERRSRLSLSTRWNWNLVTAQSRLLFHRSSYIVICSLLRFHECHSNLHCKYTGMLYTAQICQHFYLEIYYTVAKSKGT